MEGEVMVAKLFVVAVVLFLAAGGAVAAAGVTKPACCAKGDLSCCPQKWCCR